MVLKMDNKLPILNHSSDTQVKRFLSDAEKHTSEVSTAYNRVHEACGVCATSGRPHERRKISLSHIRAAFNYEIQAYFAVVNLRGVKKTS